MLYPPRCGGTPTNGTVPKSGRRPPQRRDLDLRPAKKPAIQATWCGCVLATSEEYKFLEGRFYFPRESVDWSLVLPSGLTGHRNPFGKIDWFNLEVNGVKRFKAAWSFQNLRRPYNTLDGFTSFRKGVQISQVTDRSEEVSLSDATGDCEREILEWLST